MTATMMDIATLNRMSVEEFVDAFGDVAEHSPWVAERAFDAKPFAGVESLVSAFEQAMRSATKAEQLALLRAHPDLAGKAALAGELADESRNEQAGAGLDSLTRDEYARFTRLNDAYRQAFGFPFIFAVKGATKHAILEAFESRVKNSAADEFETGLAQVARIFRFRLEDRVCK